jgi:hypothetical protein
MTGFYEGTGGEAGPLPHTIGYHEDVDLAELLDGAVLTWDIAQEKWYAGVPQVVDMELNDLINVNASPADLDVLSYQASTGLWQAASLAAGEPLPLNGLIDVVITPDPPTQRDVLFYDTVAGNWTNGLVIDEGTADGEIPVWNSSLQIWEAASSLTYDGGVLAVGGTVSAAVVNAPVGGITTLTSDTVNTDVISASGALSINAVDGLTIAAGTDLDLDFVNGTISASGLLLLESGAYTEITGGLETKLVSGGFDQIIANVGNTTIRYPVSNIGGINLNSTGMRFYDINGDEAFNATAGRIRMFYLGGTQEAIWTDDEKVMLQNNSGQTRLSIAASGRLKFNNLPDSATGLNSGEVYRSGTDLKIVP